MPICFKIWFMAESIVLAAAMPMHGRLVSFWLLSVLYLKLSVVPCSLEGQLKQFNVFVFSQQVTSSTYEEASYFNGLVE